MLTLKEEARVVKYIVELMISEQLFEGKTLKARLIKDSKHMKFTKDFNKMSLKNFYHYRDTALTFYRLKILLMEKVDGTESWTVDDYNAILSTGILLCNCLKPINSLSDKDFLILLKKMIPLLPANRPILQSFVAAESQSFHSTNLGPHELHDFLRDSAATAYLRTLECRFISTEVLLEKKTDTSKGIKIDALGWKKDGKICGIEVKTQLDDDIATKKAIRLDRYIRYCNEFYILTPYESIYQASVKWMQEHNYDEMGVILWDISSGKPLKIAEPRRIKQEVTSSMLRCIQTATSSKLIKLIGNVYLTPSDDTPESSFSKLKTAISKEFIDF